jgi:tRNA (guanosine-2'-O-)-methyltransferase
MIEVSVLKHRLLKLLEGVQSQRLDAVVAAKLLPHGRGARTELVHVLVGLNQQCLSELNLNKSHAQAGNSKAKQRELHGVEGGAAVTAEAGVRVELPAELVSKYTDIAANRQSGLVVVLENPANPANAGAILRCCDAVGATEVFVVFDEDHAAFDLQYRVVTAAAVSANLWVKTRVFRSTQLCLEALTTLGYRSVATCLHSERHRTFFEEDLARHEKLAVWFGNEAKGLSLAAQTGVTEHLYIPMRGMVESLNLSVTVGIVLAEVTRQRTASTRPDAFRLPVGEQARVVRELTRTHHALFGTRGQPRDEGDPLNDLSID